MAEYRRSPLSWEDQAEIELEWEKIDDSHWLGFAALVETETAKLARSLDPTTSPTPSPRPAYLRTLLRNYTHALFDAEANRYTGSMRSEESFVDLAGRIADRVQDRLQSLNLDYHTSEIERREAIFEALDERIEDILAVPEVRTEKDNTKQQRRAKRKEVREAYFARFPEKIYILDVCWAAKQHYREWTRWTGGELKDGSKADKAFRAILTSNKKPEEYRTESRPKNWK